jgi:hypothetical protein
MGVFTSLTDDGSGRWDYFNYFITIFFVMEVVVRLYACGVCRYFRDPFCCIDFLVTMLDLGLSVYSLASPVSSSTGAAATGGRAIGRLSRIGKFLKIIRAVRGIRLFIFIDVFTKRRSEAVEARLARMKKELKDFKQNPKPLEVNKSLVENSLALSDLDLVAANDHQRLFQCSRVTESDGSYRVNMIGEDGGTKYSIFDLRKRHISSEFGIGIGLYFYTLYYLTILMLVLGIVSLPVMVYFANDFSGQGKLEGKFKLLIGSAVCVAKWYGNNTFDATTINPSQACDLEYSLAGRLSPDRTGLCVLKTECKIGMVQVWCGTLSFFITLGFLVWYGRFVKSQSVEIDEANQTASDYSGLGSSPPPLFFCFLFF